MKNRFLMMKLFSVLISAGCFSLSSVFLFALSGARSDSEESQSDSGDLGFESFRIIHQRNVFDPNRRKPIPSNKRHKAKPAPIRSVSFTLCGTMSYGSNVIAFFNGTERDFRKSMQINDVIANHRIVEIKPDEVIMELDGERIHLAVKHSRKRRGEEAWMDSKEAPKSFTGGGGYSKDRRGGSYRSGDSDSTGSPETSESPAADVGAKSILQQMMEKRKREMEK